MKIKRIIKEVVLVGLAVLVLGACSPGGGKLTGNWVLVSFDEWGVLPSNIVTLNFDGESVSGNSGCNNYFGSYSVSGSNIQFAGLGSTMMACEEPFMGLENAFHQALGNTQNFIVSENQLQIDYTGGVLVFDSATGK
ncbi:MAG: META domain-containing protein [Chloroflexota bacterium]